VVAAYPDRIREELRISPEVHEELKRALVGVTSDGQGTAHRAKVKGIEVAGKTGTAQWGPTDRQRLAAWFAGFMPANNPEYAFAALYEGEPNVKSIGGGSHAAPLIGKVFKEVYAAKDGKAIPSVPVATPETAPEPEEDAVPLDESN